MNPVDALNAKFKKMVHGDKLYPDDVMNELWRSLPENKIVDGWKIEFGDWEFLGEPVEGLDPASELNKVIGILLSHGVIDAQSEVERSLGEPSYHSYDDGVGYAEWVMDGQRVYTSDMTDGFALCAKTVRDFITE